MFNRNQAKLSQFNIRVRKNLNCHPVEIKKKNIFKDLKLGLHRRSLLQTRGQNASDSDTRQVTKVLTLVNLGDTTKNGTNACLCRAAQGNQGK
jgi:hypothetical protein